jgi:hypothetical protein
MCCGMMVRAEPPSEAFQRRGTRATHRLPGPPHPGLGELRVATGIDPALQGLFPGVALGTVARDRLDLPLEALQGRETGSGLFGHRGYSARNGAK